MSSPPLCTVVRPGRRCVCRFPSNDATSPGDACQCLLLLTRPQFARREAGRQPGLSRQAPERAAYPERTVMAPPSGALPSSLPHIPGACAPGYAYAARPAYGCGAGSRAFPLRREGSPIVRSVGSGNGPVTAHVGAPGAATLRGRSHPRGCPPRSRARRRGRGRTPLIS